MDQTKHISSTSPQGLLAGDVHRRGTRPACARAGRSPHAAALTTSALTLDTCGIVRDCDTDAAALFSMSADTIVGRHIKRLLPDLPLRSATPDFNRVYASFCAAQPVWTWHAGNDATGRSIGLFVSLETAKGDDDQIIVYVDAASVK